MMAQVSTGLQYEVATTIADKIGQGQPLAEGMREWFAANVVEIVRVGESGGALAQTLKSAVNMLSQQTAAMGALITAVTYPLFVLVIACAVIVYLDSEVFTQFRMIKPENQWPEAGQRLVWISYLIKSWWWMVIVWVVAIIFGLRFIMMNYTGEFRPILDSIPPFSFYRRLLAARLLETLGLLVANGVVFKSAIKVMQLQAKPYMLFHLQHMEDLLSKGRSNIADVLDTGLIDEPDLMRLRVMAEVKGFEHGLIRMGLRGAEQTTATMKMIARVIGGLFLVAGGLLIIAIIQGIYMTGMALGQQ
jgi:toxin co-regulated pilus biosynthesis protein E